LLKKFPQIRSLADKEDGSSVTPDVQYALLMGAEETLREQQKLLQQIQEYEKFINTESFHMNESLDKKVAPLQLMIFDNVQNTLTQNASIESMISRYNEIINLLSEKFVYWDQLLASWEKEYK